MRWAWVLALLAVGGCSKSPKGEAGKDKAAASPLLAKKDEQCPGGTVQGCFDAALEAAQRGDAARAAELNGRLCEAGVATGCALHGDALLHGRGVTADDAQAALRFQRGCDLGDARACHLLGSLAWQGRGMTADPARAYSLYLRACDGGDATGCFSAAICHRTGTCAPKSEAETEKLLRRACEGGDARACGTLGSR